MTEKTSRVRIKVAGEKMVQKIRELVHEGNVRRIILRNADDRVLFEIPLTVGVVGAMLLPVWVALGAVAALAADYTIEVEKIEPEGELPAVAENVFDTAGAP
jgi:hypothetical protein